MGGSSLQVGVSICLIFSFSANMWSSLDPSLQYLSISDVFVIRLSEDVGRCGTCTEPLGKKIKCCFRVNSQGASGWEIFSLIFHSFNKVVGLAEKNLKLV